MATSGMRMSGNVAVACAMVGVVWLMSLGSKAAACDGHPCPTPAGKCPINTVKLGVCADVLDGLVHATVGKPPKEPCCPLIAGLADLDAAVCVCLALNANIIGLNLALPVDITLLLNYCGCNIPAGFKCA
uniref:Bifunctional inhibitor/plant lipid transfer protein/seed storage helical domain-containing protein n=1 Tax=Leersia perrieri TaxID=77586 RepID=A0A0D9WKU2_9ORYZ